MYQQVTVEGGGNILLLGSCIAHEKDNVLQLFETSNLNCFFFKKVAPIPITTVGHTWHAWFTTGPMTTLIFSEDRITLKKGRYQAYLTIGFDCISDHLWLKLRSCIKSPLLQSTSSLLDLDRNVLRNPSKNGNLGFDGLGVLAILEMLPLLAWRHWSWVRERCWSSSMTREPPSECWSLLPGSLMLLLDLDVRAPKCRLRGGSVVQCRWDKTKQNKTKPVSKWIKRLQTPKD